jgi:hypothetical protein
VSLQQVNENADCDLYIKQGEVPGRTNFDYRDVSFNTTVHVTIENPGQAEWYIGK